MNCICFCDFFFFFFFFLRIYDILMSNPLDNCRQLDNKAEVSNQKSDHADRIVQAINDLGVKFNVWRVTQIR